MTAPVKSPRKKPVKKPHVSKRINLADGRVNNNPYANKTDEERLAMIQAMTSRTRGKSGRPGGLPNGWTKDRWAWHLFCIKHTSHRYLENVIKDNELDRTNPDDAAAIEALTKAVHIMRSDSPQVQQLAAAKLILEFTKAKPSSKSDVTVHTAEDFLAQVMKDEGR